MRQSVASREVTHTNSMLDSPIIAQNTCAFIAYEKLKFP